MLTFCNSFHPGSSATSRSSPTTTRRSGSSGPRPRRLCATPPATEPPPAPEPSRRPTMSDETNQNVTKGEGYAVANLADLGEGPGLPQDPQGARGDRLRRQRDRAAPLLRDRQPLPRRAGGALLRPQRRGRDHLRRRLDPRASAPAASPGSTPRPTARSGTSATPRTPSTSSSAARTATWAGTAASPKARRSAESVPPNRLVEGGGHGAPPPPHRRLRTSGRSRASCRGGPCRPPRPRCPAPSSRMRSKFSPPALVLGDPLAGELA